jgi:hypothetical protein
LDNKEKSSGGENPSKPSDQRQTAILPQNDQNPQLVGHFKDDEDYPNNMEKLELIGID